MLSECCIRQGPGLDQARNVEEEQVRLEDFRQGHRLAAIAWIEMCLELLVLPLRQA